MTAPRSRAGVLHATPAVGTGLGSTWQAELRLPGHGSCRPENQPFQFSNLGKWRLRESVLGAYTPVATAPTESTEVSDKY